MAHETHTRRRRRPVRHCSGPASAPDCFWSASPLGSSGATAVLERSMVSSSCDCSRHSPVPYCSGQASAPDCSWSASPLGTLDCTSPVTVFDCSVDSSTLDVSGTLLVFECILSAFDFCTASFFRFAHECWMEQLKLVYLVLYSAVARLLRHLNCVTSDMLTVLHWLDSTSLCSATSEIILD